MKYNIDQLIDDLTAETKAQIKVVKKQILPLSEEDLSWRFDPPSWNIYED